MASLPPEIMNKLLAIVSGARAVGTWIYDYGRSLLPTPAPPDTENDIDDEFCTETAAFIEEVFKSENIVEKTIGGNVADAKTIFEYAAKFCENLRNGHLPDPKTMTENVVEAQNLQARKTCRKEYSKIMDKEIGEVYVSEDNLLKIHQKAQSEVLNFFNTITTPGEEQSKQAQREYLSYMIDREYNMLFQINKGKKIEAKGKILEAIRSIRNTYETAMDQVTADENAIDEKTLNEAHKKYLAEAMETWENIAEPDDLKIEFFSGLNVFIERKIDLLRRNNEEKQRIAKAEEQERKAQELYLKNGRRHIIGLREVERMRITLTKLIYG